ncbi:RadC family protein [Alcanivorax sp. IL2]|uniref:RadC family protein n=1 Tax=Alcanivorax sp. IL2 TaxID=3396310 RepID=UPI0039C488CE
MDIPTFVKNEQGLYHVQGCVKPEEIVSTAATILLDDLTSREALTAPTDVAQFLQLALAQEKNEVFSAIFLNNKHKVISFETLFTGTIDGAAVYPRVVVQHALACNAAAVIFAHNHPSGCCEPSRADQQITKRLSDALALIDVRVLDHFVVSRSEWVSLAERGMV